MKKILIIFAFLLASCSRECFVELENSGETVRCFDPYGRDFKSGEVVGVKYNNYSEEWEVCEEGVMLDTIMVEDINFDPCNKTVVVTYKKGVVK